MDRFEQQTPAPTDFEKKEEVFLSDVARLPKEFQAQWMERYEGSLEQEDALAVFAELSEFKLRRKQALNSSTLEVHSDVVNPDIRSQIDDVHDSIQHSFGRGEFFLGNGASAEVYILPIAPSLCVKHITNQEAYNENNHMREEYAFLDKLHKFTVAGVRTPKPYFIRIHPTEGHSYGMERIDGENLSRILEEPHKNVDLIMMLKQVDRTAMEQSLLAYVTELQEQFGISHNDLFKRNIMVDRQGNLYIIDFGKAKTQDVGLDHEMKFKSDLATITSEVRGFFKELDKIDISSIIEEGVNT